MRYRIPHVVYHTKLAMTRRSEIKRASLARILDAGSARLRTEGLDGAAIAPVMQDAGLTHGAFYAHFADKAALDEAAFRHAFVHGRSWWVGKVADRSWPARLVRLARRYLQPGHRDDRAGGCAFTALGADAARAPAGFRRAYADELRQSLGAVCGGAHDGSAGEARYDDAIALMALCVGGLTLARAVDDPALSDRILRVARQAAGALGQRSASPDPSEGAFP
jgi:TetR/AcrR family transcriptional repressor of nem operon